MRSNVFIEPDFSAKVCEGLTIEDLDRDALDTMKDQYANKQGNPLFRTYPDEQALSDLEMLRDGKLNYAALILLGKSEAIRKYLPQNNIVVEFRLYHSMIEYTAREEFRLPLFTAIDKVWDYINQPASNPLLHYSDGPYIFDIPSFNREAIREAILNACCHRSMLIQSEVVIKQYPDSITITNAGGLPPGVDVSNILSVNSVPRSKLMSEILQKTGLVERSGQGVDKMFYHCIMEGKALPDYSATDAYQVSLTFNAPILDQAFVVFVRGVQNRRSPNEQLNVFELLALYKICIDNDCSEIGQDILNKLESEKLISKSRNKYVLSPELYKPAAKSTLEMSGIDVKYLSVVKKCFQNEEVVSRKALISAFVGILSENRARYVIDKMLKRNLIERVENGREIKYRRGKGL